jgi:hypothetical protein
LWADAANLLPESAVGLFDMFSRKNDDKRIASALAKVKNPKAIREDRVAAIDYFADFGDPKVGVPSLLARFEYSLEHGINDTREKDACMEGILGYGAEAMPLVQEHLMTTNRIAWPIKVLKKLGTEDQVVEVLKSALDFGDVRFDQARVDKNYDILCYLIDYKVPGFADKIEHFLNDPDERVRFAATEFLIEQDDPRVPGMLERFIGDESSENTRLRKSVVEAFLKNGWTLKEPGKFPNGQVASNIFVTGQNKLEVRH